MQQLSYNNPNVVLYIPENDVDNPEISIVIPALNEEKTITTFIQWCKEGLAKANVNGEILIVDSSEDNTARKALQEGARVLKTPKRGLGRAYIDAIPYIRGEFIIMGDCDLTYDFREIESFVHKFHEGFEYVMGSRFKGSIEEGAMPKLHRYFGTPLTTWILNRLYGTSFSDIHCGMRGMTKKALDLIKIRSQGWEYASELTIKAARLKLKTTEVPIQFYKDPPGRESHHRRVGWLSPWKAGWNNLRIMLIYNPEFFLLKPGLILFLIGLLASTVLFFGPVFFGYIGFSLHAMMYSVIAAAIGFNAIQLGVLSQIHKGDINDLCTKITKKLSYDRGVIGGLCIILLGVFIEVFFIYRWVQNNFLLDKLHPEILFGLLLIIIGFQTFTFTLILHMAQFCLFSNEPVYKTGEYCDSMGRTAETMT
jgi:glycosyltransferase involved in cell wall biosynthesis